MSGQLIAAGVIFSGVFLALMQPSEAEPAKFSQDRFAVGFWVDPPADALMPERYKEIADANFTLVLGGFGATTPETIAQQIKLCEKLDLKALVAWPAGTPAKTLPESPACWGYLLRDEPSVADFGALRKRADEVRAARPGRVAYVNLYPNYASPKQLGTDSYDKYVAEFVKMFRPEVLCMDHYPAMKPDADGRDGYCANLEVMRKHSLDAGIPFWNFFNCMPYGPQADPTEAQLRWQVFTSLAYGAKGVLYFCYYTPSGAEFPKGGAIIARDGSHTRHYDEAKRLNAALKNLGPALMQLTSLAVYRVKPEDDPKRVLAGTPIKNIAREDFDPPNDYLVGVFKHADGRRAVLLNNYSHCYAAWPTVEFDAPLDQVMFVCKKTGSEKPLMDASPDMAGFQVSLDAGEGMLYLVP